MSQFQFHTLSTKSGKVQGGEELRKAVCMQWMIFWSLTFMVKETPFLLIDTIQMLHSGPLNWILT